MTHIYLDYAASTPLCAEAIAAMTPWLQQELPQNPHSRHHSFGRDARDAVEHAKGQIAALVGARAAQVILTSGATEANMTVLNNIREQPVPKRLIVLATEHASILAGAHWLHGKGVELEVIPVTTHGQAELNRLEDALRRPAGLVCAMAVNNETGVMHPLAEIIALCQRYDTPLHCDATQACRTAPLPWHTLPDHVSASLSAHKIHGPIGTGALVLGRQRQIAPLIHGGSQQNALRAGTMAPALIAGFGAAAHNLMQHKSHDLAHLANLDRHLITLLQDSAPVTCVANTPARTCGILTVILDHGCVDTLARHAPHIALSSGAACSTGHQQPSPVLRAMGYTPDAISRSVRFSFGRHTTQDMLTQALQDLTKALDS